MAKRNIIVVGGSAGSHTPLVEILAGLPVDLPASILVALHRNAGTGDLLARVLGRMLPFEVHQPDDGEPLRPGVIYVAPSDAHLALRDGRCSISAGPRENMSRPSIDVLFRSAAVDAGSRVIGVLLSGYLNDGAAGLGAIAGCGGVTIVQDPDNAACPDMPEAALTVHAPTHCLPSAQIAARLVALVGQDVAPGPPPEPRLVIEAEMAWGAGLSMNSEDTLGERSRVTCPECHGVLWEQRDSDMLRFRCHTGHAYTVETLERAQRDEVEHGMWIALRALRERAETLRRLGERSGSDAGREAWMQRAAEAERLATSVSEGLITLRRVEVGVEMPRPPTAPPRQRRKS